MFKKIMIFLLMIGVLTCSGCNKEVVTDVSAISYLDNTSKENIAYNLGIAASNIKSAKFKGTLIVKDKEYNFSGEVIVGSSIENSLLHINYKDNNLYLKKGNVYLSYFYNNTNVIVKDSLDNYVYEIKNLLSSNNIKCNEEKIFNVLKNKNLDDINFISLSEKVVVRDNEYLISDENVEVTLNNKYLPINMKLVKKDIYLSINFEYSPVKINVPFGFDLITIDIDSIKDLLGIENIGELIK